MNVKISYPFGIIKDIFESSKLALIFTVTNSQSKETKTFHSFNDTIDEMFMHIDPVEAIFNVKNPNSGVHVSFVVGCNVNISPTNIDAFNQFITQLAGFNVHGEMYVLNQLVNNEITTPQINH
ncbi:hypothetical protein [Photobacterium carnosum]|uniref:hypothetical protein n=1 Tax=Photobacterium carnosum TaxID=2023717 RepID=UPI001E61F48B|nr:hypothetical protein [Photobacterium carnosum]MCD9528498.1 hypothetical protein [Photobacterium carnosum]